jgi:hypothetical protein
MLWDLDVLAAIATDVELEGVFAVIGLSEQSRDRLLWPAVSTGSGQPLAPAPARN